ncbi:MULTISPECIES: hypothetical protein [Prauserella]|uniref:Uncharacterized protein n=1 Tax=Prauserella endophytica TaxID=1592324 RepID=A0ABY2S3P6_9PSEU|nr:MULTISPECIES: hypothetical protein [Prauserella]TKG70105.1 hypothetical protein FCN18_18625 [Prauserella endophytica]
MSERYLTAVPVRAPREAALALAEQRYLGAAPAAVHAICPVATVDSRPGDTESVTTTRPTLPAVTVNGAASGATPVPGPRARSSFRRAGREHREGVRIGQRRSVAHHRERLALRRRHGVTVASCAAAPVAVPGVAAPVYS